MKKYVYEYKIPNTLEGGAVMVTEEELKQLSKSIDIVDIKIRNQIGNKEYELIKHWEIKQREEGEER